MNTNFDIEGRGNYQRFSIDIGGVLSLHLDTKKNIQELLDVRDFRAEHKDFIEGLYYELIPSFRNIEDAFKKFIDKLSGTQLKEEVERQSYELFPDILPDENERNYVKIKIIFEFVSSFLKISISSWTDIQERLRKLLKNSDTKITYDKINGLYLTKINDLNLDTQAFLDKIKSTFHGNIVGGLQDDPDFLVSNLLYEEDINYDYSVIFKGTDNQGFIVHDLHEDEDLFQEFQVYDSEAPSVVKQESQVETEHFYTNLIGTKEWNRSDSYILCIKNVDLKEEEKKFYGSSFVVLNPTETANINMAAALVRKNSGYSFVSRYTQMLNALLEYAFNNLMNNDFPNFCDDGHTFLYHIGPVVMYLIIQEDMNRRDFGHCYFVERNALIKLLPENIIKKHIIDFWGEKFSKLTKERVDSYINYSKGVQNIRSSYYHLFNVAASTKKRGRSDNISIEVYLKMNMGKFFGYRRAQVYRRFVNDCVFGTLHENNSVELVNKFF